MPRQSPFVITLTREERAELAGGQEIYVTVSRRRAGEDRAPGEPGLGNDASPLVSACHARSSASGVSVLYRSAAWSRRAAARRATSPLFPPVSWLRSRRWLVSCRRAVAFPWLAGLSPNCARRRWPAASLQRSAAPRSGAGLARTHCAPGAIAAGSSRATRSLPARPAASSICISAAGKVQRWGRAITCSASTRRPASRQGGANIRSLPPAPGRPIYVEHEYARAGALAYLAAWDVHRARLFGRCERKNGIAAFDRLVAQVMGQATVSVSAPRVPDRRQWLLPPRSARLPTGCAPNGPISFWSIRRSTPVGSTRSRSTSPSSSASSSLPATLPDLADSEAERDGLPGCAINEPPSRSSGPSPAAISTSCLRSSSKNLTV